MTWLTGLSVTRAISATSRSASAGEPSASITTTLVEVTMKPALEMKFWLAGEPSADSPCTYQQPGAASRACMGGSSAGASAAAAWRVHAGPSPSIAAHAPRRKS